MTGWFVFLVLLAAVNPPRLRPYLDSRDRPVAAVVAVGITVGLGALLAVLATEVLAALQITVETWHLGTGVVGSLVGARVLVAPAITGVEIPDGTGAALVPFAFPLLITPQLATLMVLLGAAGSAPAAIGWLATVLTITVGTTAVPYRRPGVWSAMARTLGALLVVLAIALIVAGIRDV